MAPPFDYRAGELHCDRVALSRIAAEVGTPFYVYSADRVRDNHRRLAAVFAPLLPLICYSVKANSSLALLRLLKLDVGAYGFPMTSNYNSHPRPAEVLVEASTYRTIRRQRCAARTRLQPRCCPPACSLACTARI